MTVTLRRHFALEIHKRVFIAQRWLSHKEAYDQAASASGRARNVQIHGSEKQGTRLDGTTRKTTPFEKQAALGNVYKRAVTIIA